MGQYYKPIFLGEKEDGKPETIKAFFYSHDYDNGLKLMEHSWMRNDFVATIESQLSEGAPFHKSRLVWAGDYADKEENSEKNLYHVCEDSLKMKPRTSKKMYRYILNHTKMEFIDKRKIPKSSDGWQVHPLPLLTSEGCGMGGGDFHGESNSIGIWARDSISVQNKKPIGFTEITCPDFKE